jgi:hypothetical protein
MPEGSQGDIESHLCFERSNFMIAASSRPRSIIKEIAGVSEAVPRIRQNAIVRAIRR